MSGEVERPKMHNGKFYVKGGGKKTRPCHVDGQISPGRERKGSKKSREKSQKIFQKQRIPSGDVGDGKGVDGPNLWEEEDERILRSGRDGWMR
jgi:hypothetical protein